MTIDKNLANRASPRNKVQDYIVHNTGKAFLGNVIIIEFVKKKGYATCFIHSTKVQHKGLESTFPILQQSHMPE